MEIIYSAAGVAGRDVLRALGVRVGVEGAEHLPASGPVIIAANQVSYLDFLLVGLAARRRRVRFLTRYDVWRNPLVGPLMDRMRHVPVDRAAPAGAYLRARSLLRDGEAVGIFPEAGVSTSYTVRGLMPGAMALARDTGAVVVPVAIWGPQRVHGPLPPEAAPWHPAHLGGQAPAPEVARRSEAVLRGGVPPSWVLEGDDVAGAA